MSTPDETVSADAVSFESPSPETVDDETISAEIVDAFFEAVVRTGDAIAKLTPEQLGAVEQFFDEFATMPLDDARSPLLELDRVLRFILPNGDELIDSFLLVSLLAEPETIELPEGIAFSDPEMTHAQLSRLRMRSGRHAAEILQLQIEGPLDWTRVSIKSLIEDPNSFPKDRVHLRVWRWDRQLLQLVMTAPSYAQLLVRLMDALGRLPDSALEEINSEEVGSQLRAAAHRVVTLTTPEDAPDELDIELGDAPTD